MTTPDAFAPDAFDRAAAHLDTEDRLRKRAGHGHCHKKAFAIHAAAFVGANALLFVIWVVVALFGGAWFPWFVFPLAGWGIGLAAHYFAVRDTWQIRETGWERHDFA